MVNTKILIKSPSKTGCVIRIKQISNDNPENKIKGDLKKLSHIDKIKKYYLKVSFKYFIAKNNL
jgi:hypothetical protein